MLSVCRGDNLSSNLAVTPSCQNAITVAPPTPIRLQSGPGPAKPKSGKNLKQSPVCLAHPPNNNVLTLALFLTRSDALPL